MYIQLTTLVQTLLFADDFIVCTERKEDMERSLAEMKVGIEKWGVSRHWGKTRLMMVSRSGEECKISVDGKGVEEVLVDKLKYLGVMISGDGGKCRRKLKCGSLMLWWS